MNKIKLRSDLKALVKTQIKPSYSIEQAPEIIGLIDEIIEAVEKLNNLDEYLRIEREGLEVLWDSQPEEADLRLYKDIQAARQKTKWEAS